jgi:Tfp pilus assembly protein PilO
VLQRALREHRRPLLALAIALVANLGLYGFVVYPMSKRVAEADARAAAADGSRRAAAAEFAAARRLADGKAQAEAELKTFYEEVLPDDLSAAQRATYVSLAQLARETNLRLARRQARPHQVLGAALDRLQISIALEGDYQDIRQFIHRLETAPSFVVIDDLGIEQAAMTDDTLRLSLELSTYYRAEAHGD